MKPIPRPLPGYKRAYKQCRECKRCCYYDYVPYSLSNPVMWLPCGHGIGDRDRGMLSVSRAEFYAARRT